MGNNAEGCIASCRKPGMRVLLDRYDGTWNDSGRRHGRK
jgi:hypothetical protein